MSDSQHWWVRRAGRIDGPLTVNELQILAAQGIIDGAAELSHDRQHWSPAARTPGLHIPAPGPPQQSQPTDPPPLTAPEPQLLGPHAKHRRLRWIVAGVMAGATLMIALCSGLVFSTSPAQPAAATAEVSAEELQRNATWEYWHWVRAVFTQVPQNIRTREQAAAAVERIAVQIEQLPTLHVDLDAVQCAHNLATFWRDAGQQLRRQNSPSLMAESMLRGLSGDPFGTAVEELQRYQAFEAEGKSVLQHCQQTRALLTARYGVEFPSMLNREE